MLYFTVKLYCVVLLTVSSTLPPLGLDLIVPVKLSSDVPVIVITPYWIKRLVYEGFRLEKGLNHTLLINDRWYAPKPFTENTMTLGYPSKCDSERILKLEHKGIEIREGNPEWGAEPGKIYRSI